MTSRTAGFIAWPVWILCALGTGVWLLFSVLNKPTVFPPVLEQLAYGLVVVSVGATALILALKRPENPIGWLLLAMAVLGSTSETANQYAFYTLYTAPGTLPGGALAAWFYRWPINLLLGMLALIILLFPTGKPLSMRWRLVGWGIAIAAIGASLSRALEPQLRLKGQQDATIVNPFGLQDTHALFNTLGPLFYIIFLLFTVAAAVSMVLRYRRTSGDERQQLKWFTYATGLWLLASLTVLVLYLIDIEVGRLLWLQFVSLSGIPLAIGVAILKYRLYAIDIVINRTLVYGPFTAILAGVYIAGIGIGKTLFTEFTGVGSNATVALVTLVVAAALTPLKNRLQTAVDRKFKVAKDPKKELAHFVQQTRSVIETLDSAHSLLAFAASAVGARSAAVYLGEKDGSPAVITHGEPDPSPAVTLPLAYNGSNHGYVTFGSRRSGEPFTDTDRRALEDAAKVLAQVVALQATRGSG